MTEQRDWRKLSRTSLAVGLVVLIPALAAWIFGRTFIFPSLGPSAYYLVVTRKQNHRMRHVLGGHLIGLAFGYAAYHLLVHHGAIMTIHLAPLSAEGLRLAAAGVLAVIATTAAMRLLRVAHPPACSTALIVALGLLPTPLDALLIMVSVLVMTLGYRLLVRLEAMP